NMKDDAPSISTNSTTEPNLTVDETNLAVNASASFAGLFTGAYGADGAGTTSYGVTTTADGTDSGLVDVATGSAILLYNTATGVEGRVGGVGGPVAFSVTVNGSGVVTLDQVRALQHSPDTGPDQNSSTILDSAIKLVATITDKDGDSASAAVNIGANLNMKDDAPSISTNSTTEPNLTVDETNLATDASASFAGLFTSSFGADGAGAKTYGISVSSVGVDSGLIDTVTGQHIYLYQSGSTVVGRVGAGGVANPAGAISFVVTVNSSTGLVTLDQQRAIFHTPDSGPDQATFMANDSLIKIVAVVTDKDGDVASASVNIASNLVFKDDAPSIIDPADATLANTVGATTTVVLDIDSNVLNNFGADGPGSVQFNNIVNGQDTSLKSSGVMIELWLSPDGQTLQGRTGSTNGSDGTLIYTVQINQNAGTYTVTMAASIDNGAGVSFNDLTSSAAGNADFRGVGADSAATPVDLLLSASIGNGTSTSVNTNSTAIGAANQSMDNGETLRIDFVSNLTSGATTPTGFTYGAHVGTSSFLQTVPQVQGSQSETVAIRVYALNTTDTAVVAPDRNPAGGFTNSTIIGVTTVTVDGYAPGETPVTVAIGAVGVWTNIAYGVYAQLQADGSVIFTGIQEGDQYGFSTGSDFNAVAITSLPTGIGPVGHLSSNDSFDLGVFAIGAVQTGDPVNLDFDLKITDADGDTVLVPGGIHITANPPAPPIVIDLDGDGAEFVGHEAGVLFDYGAGLVATAWASADDAILVRDSNGNGLVDNASEFVFGHDGMTDLEALHAQYGEQLDASDADFTMFALWQDANLNGIVDGGELMSLAEAGIVSINLVSDGNSYSAANGEVVVAGTTTYNRADGTTGTAADAMFATGGAAKTTGTVEKIAANTNTTLVAAAVAAAGFAVAAPVAAHSFEAFDLGDHLALGGSEAGNVVSSVSAIEATGSAFALATALTSGMHLEALQIQNLPTFETGSAFQAGDLGAMSGMEVATQSLLTATDAMAAHMTIPTMASDIVMPTAESLAAMNVTGVQHNTTVEQILADALHGGNAPSIDALFNALPNVQANGGNLATDSLASGFDASVPTWDMGHGATFTGGAELITHEALMLHHDAIQPAVNG
ncbi:MAG: DUF5801 repeats-in-toxin domain-containing protein, partial [Sphingomicrobium sp.]